ncbi:MAG: hypothetical protein R6U54_04115 [Candidatus Omnitrophota bacterium]
MNPPRGGLSDTERITYQAARGEKVVIKGSEEIKGWRKIRNDTWTVTLPFSGMEMGGIKIHGAIDMR